MSVQITITTEIEAKDREYIVDIDGPEAVVQSLSIRVGDNYRHARKLLSQLGWQHRQFHFHHNHPEDIYREVVLELRMEPMQLILRFTLHHDEGWCYQNSIWIDDRAKEIIYLNELPRALFTTIVALGLKGWRVISMTRTSNSELLLVVEK